MARNNTTSMTPRKIKAIITGSIIAIAVPLVPLVALAGFFFLTEKTTKTITELYPSPDNTYIVFAVNVDNSSADDETELDVAYTEQAPEVGCEPPKGSYTLLTGYEGYTYSVDYQNDSEFTVYVHEVNDDRVVQYAVENGRFYKISDTIVDPEEQ